MGERGQISTLSTLSTLSTHLSGIGKEKAAKQGPLSHRCSRIILSPTGS